MTKIPYTQEQIQTLRSNQYVKSCTEKYITFTDDCRITALKLDDKKWYHKDIFRYFWFPDFIIDSEIPRHSLKDWRKRVRNKWAAGIIESKKGRKKKEKIDISQMTKDEYIQYLEAKTAYLEEIQKKIYGEYP